MGVSKIIDEHPYNTQPNEYAVNISGNIAWDVDSKRTPSASVVAALKEARPEIQTTRFRRNVLDAIWNDGIEEAFGSEQFREKYIRRLKRWTKVNVRKHLIKRCEILDSWQHRDARFVPDAYLVDAAKKTVVCYEVEDTHPLNPWSIGQYGAAWFCLEYIYWDLHLIAYDIYGNFRIVKFPESELLAQKIQEKRKPPPA